MSSEMLIRQTGKNPTSTGYKSPDYSMRATQSNPELSRDQSWDEVKARQENKKFLKKGYSRD